MTHTTHVGVIVGCISFLFLCFGAAAGQRRSVVILHTGQDGVVAALNAEILSMGMQPLTLKIADDDVAPDTVSQAAERADAVAVMRVMPSGKTVEVWISGALSNDDDAFEVVMTEKSDRPEALLALKTVELLRVKLARIAEEKEKTDEPVSDSPEPVSRKKTLPRPSRVSCGFQPALVYGFGELPVTLLLHIEAGVRLLDGLSLRGFGLMPTYATTLEDAEGTVDVRIGIVGGGVFYAFLPRTRRVQPSLGLSVATGLMRMQGHATGVFRDGDPLVAFPVGIFSTGLAIALTRVLSIRLDMAAGIAFKRPVVRFAGRKITGWGRPILYGMLGIEVWLF
jgi:hypothetical protein